MILTMLQIYLLMHGDTLSLDIWDTWFTPSYLMQYPKFLKYVKKHNKEKKNEYKKYKCKINYK